MSKIRDRSVDWEVSDDYTDPGLVESGEAEALILDMTECVAGNRAFSFSSKRMKVLFSAALIGCSQLVEWARS